MTKKRRPIVFTVLVIALLVVPLLEILAIVQVGRVIGGWPTIGLLLLLSAIGAWLVRREGSRTWDALREALATGRMPATQLVDAALVLVGGVLLLAPGFLSDLLGFFFILPMTRPITARWLQAAVERQLLGRAGIVRGTAR
ncbi:MAG: FxsA family protein [Micrococcales bacterium]|nr:FxsA family protein [Micrococcales bacterium]